MEARPLPFRPLNRRSGRIPAEPYPPFKFLQRRTKHSGVKAINPRGSGTESPRPTQACPSERSRFRILPPGVAFSQLPINSATQPILISIQPMKRIVTLMHSDPVYRVQAASHLEAFLKAEVHHAPIFSETPVSPETCLLYTSPSPRD